MQNIYVKKTISSVQMMYAVAVFIISSNLLTTNLYRYTKNQSWLAIIIAAAAGLVLVSVYGRLVQNHMGSSLFDINETVFGKVVGKVISAFYVFFFLTLTVLNTRDLGDFVKAFVLQSTPINIIYVIFIVICAYAVKKGAQRMTQYGTFIFFSYVIMLIFVSVLLVTIMHPSNFLPVFTVPFKNQLLSAHMTLMLPLGEVFVFLTMMQHMQKPETAGSAFRRGLLIGAAFLLVIVSRDIAVLGEYTAVASRPTFVSIRLINIGDILTRIEIINAVFLMILLFFKTSVLLFATVSGFSNLFNIKGYSKVTFIFSILVVISAKAFFKSSFEHLLWFRAAPSYSMFFLLFLPVVTMIVSEIKKRRMKIAADTSQ